MRLGVREQRREQLPVETESWNAGFALGPLATPMSEPVGHMNKGNSARPQGRAVAEARAELLASARPCKSFAIKFDQIFALHGKLGSHL